MKTSNWHAVIVFFSEARAPKMLHTPDTFRINFVFL